jgi:hypothetical protein
LKHDYISKLKSVSTGKNVLLFLVPACVVYFTMLLFTIPEVRQYTSGTEIFDLSPAGYSYEYAMRLLDALGVEGREAYLYRQLPLDFIYPALFAVSSCLLLIWVLSKGRTVSPAMYYLSLVPIVAALLDYLENIQIMLMILNYPEVPELLVTTSSIATIGKSGLTTIFFMVLIVGFVRLALARKAE